MKFVLVKLSSVLLLLDVCARGAVARRLFRNNHRGVLGPRGSPLGAAAKQLPGVVGLHNTGFNSSRQKAWPFDMPEGTKQAKASKIGYDAGFMDGVELMMEAIENKTVETVKTQTMGYPALRQNLDNLAGDLDFDLPRNRFRADGSRKPEIAEDPHANQPTGAGKIPGSDTDPNPSASVVPHEIINELCLAGSELCEADSLRLDCTTRKDKLSLKLDCTKDNKFLQNLTLVRTTEPGNISARFNGRRVYVTGAHNEVVILEDENPRVGNETWNMTQVASGFFEEHVDEWMEGDIFHRLQIRRDAMRRGKRWWIEMRSVKGQMSGQTLFFVPGHV